MTQLIIHPHAENEGPGAQVYNNENIKTYSIHESFKTSERAQSFTRDDEEDVWKNLTQPN